MEHKYKLISQKYREFFLPTLAMTVANNIALFVDSVLVSTFLGIEKMPAIQICFPVLAFVNMVYWMLGLGGSLLASNHMADHKKDEADRIFSVSMVTVVAFGVLLAISGSVFLSGLTGILCRDEVLRGDVAEYLGVMLLGFPLLCFIMSLSYYARSDGMPKIGFQAVLISNAVNLCMDTVLIKVFGMGLAGAALATVIGYVCGALYMLRYILNRDRQFRFRNPFGTGFFADIKNISVKGFPTASSQLYIMLRTQILNMIITVYGGSIGLQTFSIYNNSLFLAYMVFIGTAQTLSPIVSVYAHEGDFDRARYVLRRSIGIVLASAVFMGTLFALCPQIILSLYNVKQQETVNACIAAIRMYVLSYPGLAFFYIMSYYFQAIKEQRLSAVMTALEGLVFPVGIIWALTPSLKMTGVWLGVILTDTLAAIIILVYLGIRKADSRGVKRSFLLPADMDPCRYEFTVPMKTNDVVRLSKEAGDWVKDRLDGHKSMHTCLALEEMLTGIVMANPERDDVIDVVLREEEGSVIISIRDMGTEFNPTIYDNGLEYRFDNATVLNRIAREISFDRSLGMNSTLIRI